MRRLPAWLLATMRQHVPDHPEGRAYAREALAENEVATRLKVLVGFARRGASSAEVVKTAEWVSELLESRSRVASRWGSARGYRAMADQVRAVGREYVPTPPPQRKRQRSPLWSPTPGAFHYLGRRFRFDFRCHPPHPSRQR